MKEKIKFFYYFRAYPLLVSKMTRSALALLLVVGVGGAITLNIRSRTNIAPKAAPRTYGAIDYSSYFKEEVIFEFKDPCQVKKYIGETDLITSNKPVVACRLPSSVQMSGTNYQFNKRSFLIIDNPAKDMPFYKVEVTYVDDGRSDQRAYLTLVDNLWGSGVVHGISAGLNTTASPNGTKANYWYEHTNMYPLNPSNNLTQAQKDFDVRVKNRMLTRRPGNIKLELYVTPKGTYGVIDGKNTASFPHLYSSPYLYDWNKFNYISLSKNDASAAGATFKSLKVTKLPNPVITTELVDAYFLKKAAERDVVEKPVDTMDCIHRSLQKDNLGRLSTAFNYYAQDYYFRTNHLNEIRSNVNLTIGFLNHCMDYTLSKFGTDPTQGLNVGISNSTKTQTGDSNTSLATSLVGFQGFINQTGAMASVLTTEQLRNLQIQYAKFIDVMGLYMSGEGMGDPYYMYPKTNYIGDTYAENSAWTGTFLSNYLRYFSDTYREGRVKDLLYFVMFHYLSMDESIARVDSGFKFNVLDNRYLNFQSRYVHDDYTIANHGFIPSVSYGSQMILAYGNTLNIMKSLGMKTTPLVDRNLRKFYDKQYGLIDNKTLHLAAPIKREQDLQAKTISPRVMEDIITIDSNTDKMRAFFGLSQPSRTEERGALFTIYPGMKAMGDDSKAIENASSVYYLLYPGNGIFFSNDGGMPYQTFNGHAYHAFIQNLSIPKISLPSRSVEFIDSMSGINPKNTLPSKDYNYRARIIDKGKNVSSVKIYMANITAGNRVWTEVASPRCTSKSCEVSWSMKTPAEKGNYFLKITVNYSDGTSCSSDPYKYQYDSKNDFCGVEGFMAFRNMSGATQTSMLPPTPIAVSAINQATQPPVANPPTATPGTASGQNHAPQIKSGISAALAKKGVNFTKTIQVNDLDLSDQGGITLTAAGLPAGLSISNISQTVQNGKVIALFKIVGVPLNKGTYTIRLTAKDRAGTQNTKTGRIFVR